MTRFEQIASAYPLHAQRIAECVATYSGARYFDRFMTEPADGFDLEHGAGAALQGAFCWNFTPEGHNYWSALANGARA